MEGMRRDNYVCRDQLIGVNFISKLDIKQRNAGRAPNRAYQPAVYAAQDGESKDSLMQEMKCRK